MYHVRRMDPVDALNRELDAWEVKDEDPLFETGFSQSLDRVRALVPLILKRMKKERQNHPAALEGIREVLAVLREWLGTRIESLDGPSPHEARIDRAVEEVLKAVIELRGTRFGRDLERIGMDLRLLRGWLHAFADQARRRPSLPPLEEDEWTKDQWKRYLHGSVLRKFPVVAGMEGKPITPENLERASRAHEADAEDADREAEEFIERGDLEERLQYAWNPDNPEHYLDLPDLPVPPDQDEEVEEPAWDEPEGEEWKDDADSTDFRGDALFQSVEGLLMQIMRLRLEPTPVHTYLTALLFATQSALIHGLTAAEDGDDAAREAAHEVAKELLGRFVGVAAEFPELIAEARRIIASGGDAADRPDRLD